MLRKCWPLLVILLFQFGTLYLMSRRAASAKFSGVEVQLRTEAYDPFDPLAGRYVQLHYQVEGDDSNVPYEPEEGEQIWITVQRAEPAWARVGLDLERGAFTIDRVSLRAEWRQGRARIPNASRLYMQEELCLEADELLRRDANAGIVTLGVDEAGNAIPKSLKLGNRIFYSSK